MAKKMIKKIVKSAKKPVSKATKPVAKKAPVKAAAKKPVAKKAAVKVVAKKPVAKVVAKKAAPKAVVKPVAAIVAKPVEKPFVKPAGKTFSRPNSHHREAPKVYAPMSVKEQKALYKVGNYVVYPTHGVGKILAEETQQIGEIELRLLVINFEKDKMTLRVPMQRATAAGLRPISGADKMKEVYVTLKSKSKTSRGMWSRRAQEYESKINLCF